MIVGVPKEIKNHEYRVGLIPAGASALTQATLPYALELARLGLQGALAADAGLMQGLQTHAGQVTHAEVAQDSGRPYVAAAHALDTDYRRKS